MAQAERKPGLKAGIILIVVLGLGLWWLRAPKVQVDYDAFPNAYIAAEDAGYDPGPVVVVRGGAPPPFVDLPGGRRAWPAYVLARLPLKEGKPFIFPRIVQEGKVMSSPLPPDRQVLRDQEFLRAKPYLTPEAEAIIARMSARP